MAALSRPRLLAQGWGWPALSLALLLSLPTVSIPAPLSAQTPAPHSPRRHGIFLDDLDVRLVRLEVTARDEAGRPLTDLEAADFRVFRDGREVAVESFQAPHPIADRASEDHAGETARPDDELFTVVLLDEAYLKGDDRRRLAEALTAELPGLLADGGRVLLARQRRQVYVEQTFTRDAVLLERALTRFAEAAPDLQSAAWAEDQTLRNIMRGAAAGWDGPDSQLAFDSLRSHARALAQREAARLDALGRFLDSLSAVDGRKAVVQLSSGFHLAPAERLFEVWLERFDPTDTQRRAGLERTRGNLEDDLQDLIARANGAGAAFYTLRLPLPDVAEEGPRNMLSQHSRIGLQGDQSRALSLLADSTAGQHRVGLEELDDLVARAREDLTHRYEIYVAAGDPEPDRRHQVRVEVARPGARLAYLDSYRDKDAAQRLEDATLAALFFDLASNPLDARLELGRETRDGRRFVVPLTIKVPLDRLVLLPEARTHRGRLSVFIAVRDADGRVSEPWRRDVNVTLSNEELLNTITRSARYLTELLLTQGPQKVAIGVRDELAAVGSTFNIQLHIGARAGSTVETP